MNEEQEQLKAELARLKKELENAGYERQRLGQLLQQQPDKKLLGDMQGQLKAATAARAATEERNHELVRLVSQASARQQQLEQELLQNQRHTHDQLAQLQTLLGQLQEERDELIGQLAAQGAPNASELLSKLHAQLKQLHQSSKEKLETLTDELKRRHTLWEQETQSRADLERSFSTQTEAYQKDIKGLKTSLRDLRSDLEDHKHALETTEDQIGWLENEIEDREEIIDSMRSQLGSYLDKLRKAQNKLNEAGQALQHRNSMLKQFQEQRMLLASQCRAWEASYNKSEAERKGMETQIKLLKARVDELEWELEETNVSLDDSQKQVVNLQEQLHRQLPQAHQLLVQAQQRVKELEHRLTSGEDTLSEIQAVGQKVEADL